MERRPNARSVVKTGGTAKEQAEAEDVTRDTYGVPEPAESEQAREAEFRRAETSGDRLASRDDAAKARTERRR